MATTAVTPTLGEHDEASRVALPIIEKVFTAINENEEIDDLIKIMRSRPPFDDPSIYSIVGIEPITQSEWGCIARFFSRTWFERVWIVRELILAQKAGFFCGDFKIDYSNVKTFVNFLSITGWDTSLGEFKSSIDGRLLQEEEDLNTGVHRLFSMHLSSRYKGCICNIILNSLRLFLSH
jgi:hypothetical protein